MLGRNLLQATSRGGWTSNWTPADASPALWLDASDNSTITTVSGAVSQWNDKSGNSRHVAQSSTASRPTLSTFNNLQCLLFDGSNDSLVNSTSITSDTYSGQLNVYWVAARSGNGGTIFCERQSAPVGISQWANVSGGYYISSNGSIPSSNTTIALATYNKLASGGGVVSHHHLPNQRDVLWLNGSSETVTGGTATVINGATAGFRIGGRELSTQYWNGRICEVVVMTTSQTEAERQLFEGYLANKWALSSLLPSSHPYS